MQPRFIFNTLLSSHFIRGVVVATVIAELYIFYLKYTFSNVGVWTTNEQTVARPLVSLVTVRSLDVAPETLLPELDEPRVAGVVGSKAQVILVEVGNLRWVELDWHAANDRLFDVVDHVIASVPTIAAKSTSATVVIISCSQVKRGTLVTTRFFTQAFSHQWLDTSAAPVITTIVTHFLTYLGIFLKFKWKKKRTNKILYNLYLHLHLLFNNYSEAYL